MSDDTVVEMNKFREKKPEQVLECPCGGQHFYLHFVGKGKVGDIECRLCGKMFSDKCWGMR